MTTSLNSSSSADGGAGTSARSGSSFGIDEGATRTVSGSGNGDASSGVGRAPWPTLAATFVVALAGCAALYQATLGLQVVSTEDGRRLDVAGAPRAVPAAALDWPPRPQLGATLRADGRVAIVTFIYTSCNAVCSVLGSEFQQLQQAIVARGLQHKVRLLSVTFDPRDDTARLAGYALRQHADAGVWQFAGIPAAAERKAVLATFGIVVVPAPLGEFVHNAAFHIVDTHGRLARIDDFDKPEQALADAVALYDAANADRAAANRPAASDRAANVGHVAATGRAAIVNRAASVGLGASVYSAAALALAGAR